MKRTSFLTRSLTAAAAGSMLPGAFAQAEFAQTGSPGIIDANADPNNVLVVVQLNGGNDGLNMVVPYSDDAYYKARPAIAVDPKTVLKLNDRIGWNPALAGLGELYKQAHVALMQGIGYPDPNLSHFEATQ